MVPGTEEARFLVMYGVPSGVVWDPAARAAFRFEEDQRVTIVAAADSTIPVHGVRLRNRVLSAESLWMVVENLTRVVFDRFCREHGIDPSAGDAKHLLALALGFKPRKLEVRSDAVQALIDTGELDPKSLKRDNSHLDALDAHIRLNIPLRRGQAVLQAAQGNE